MPDPVSIRAVFDLPPERAIAFLDSKGYRVSVNWTDTFDEEHDASFTVAKIAKVDLLRAIHISLLEAQTNGTPYAAWLAQLKPTLAEAGWWGKVGDTDITGTDKPVFIGPRRLRTIYDTNLRMARSAALWERVQASKVTLPFLRYSAVLDRRTRPQHAAWHGVILPVDHPFWLTHFPPCGWNCRCTAIQVNEAMMERRGWKVTEPAPPIVPVPFYNRSTGQTVQVPRGIDPGFGYNPGIARMQATADKVAASLVQARREGLPIDDAAIADLLSELPNARALPVATLRALIIAGEVAELAAALMGEVLATAATKRRLGGKRRPRRMGRAIKTSAGKREYIRDEAGRFARVGAIAWSKPAPPPIRRKTAAEVAAFSAIVRADRNDNRSRLTLGSIDRPDASLGLHTRPLALKADLHRHTLNRHGPDSDDPLPLEDRDFARIMMLVDGPSAMKPTYPSSRGNPMVEVKGRVDGRDYALILELIDNRRFQGAAVYSFYRPSR